MRFRRRDFLFEGLGAALAMRSFAAPPEGLTALRFEPVQPSFFGASEGSRIAGRLHTTGYPDLFCWLQGGASESSYRNDGGTFVGSAPIEKSTISPTRAGPVGRFNADGRSDLYVGSPERLVFPTAVP